MTDDDDLGEYIWPPQYPSDISFVQLVVEIIGQRRFFQLHKKAWDRLTEPGLGIEPDKSLLEELYARSGSFSKPFLDIAVREIFIAHLDSSNLQETVESVLFDRQVSAIEHGHESLDDQIRSDQALELYCACVCEITTMFACVLLHAALNDSRRAPASSSEPFDRAVYIRESLKKFQS